MTTCVISIDRRERVVTQFLQLDTGYSVINCFSDSNQKIIGKVFVSASEVDCEKQLLWQLQF